MCGLLFLYQPAWDVEQIKTRAAAALKLLRHRGPDDSGLSLNKTWAMGHTRLSIIDLAASRQPMRDPSGRYYLAFNGEIYNFRSLRDALKHQWQFTTNGDTEVVLAGLAIQGEKFLPKMEGMWAIALWDDEKKNLFLSRDRMGKKPLYFQAADGAFSCASELPALRHIASGPPEEDMDSTADYLTYGYHLPGTTAYKGIREVLPGHMLSWRPGADISQRPYWSLYPSRFSGTFSQAAQKLRENLIQAVEARLVADVEVGAFLSGGVDSSLVVGILTKELGISPKTFTIGFSEAAFDERGYARKTANSFGTQHFERTLDHWDQNRLTDLIVKHVGQPFSDSSILPTACVAELASEHVKVALSGDGGDELFSGYQRYHARTLLRWYTRLPKSARSSLQRVIRAVPEPMAHHSCSLLKKAHLFVDIVERHHDETPHIAPRSYSRARFAVLAPDLVGKGHPPPLLPETCETDDTFRMMVADSLVYLPQDILVKVDRASMAHSLEARAPFLDRKVIELAFSLPWSWHRRFFLGKRMLRSAFTNLLPESIWKRRKQGFAIPVHQWFRNGMERTLLGMVNSVSSPINERFVRSLLTEHLNGSRDHGYRLWNIMVYLLWRDQCLRKLA